MGEQMGPVEVSVVVVVAVLLVAVAVILLYVGGYLFTRGKLRAMDQYYREAKKRRPAGGDDDPLE